jgi:drug/metabolite transporter (DMT)-like permease
LPVNGSTTRFDEPTTAHAANMPTEQTRDLVLTAPAAREHNAAELLSWLISRWWVAFAGAAIFVVAGHVLIKAGLNDMPVLPAGTALVTRVVNALLHVQVLGGLMIYSLGTVCWMRAVSLKDISFLYPLSSVNYVLVAAISTLLFHEVITARRAGGILVIIAGMILMNHRSSEGRP